MKHLYQPEVVAELQQRIGRLQSGAKGNWGTMNAAQALAHCATSLQMALGLVNPRRTRRRGSSYHNHALTVGGKTGDVEPA